MTTLPNPARDQTDWLTSLQSLLATVVIAVFVITFIVQAFQIPSESMENTLLIGDYLLVDKLCYGGSGNLTDSLPPDPARRHHRVSLPGESVAAFREACDWRARRSHSPGEQARVRERRAADRNRTSAFSSPKETSFATIFPALDVLDPGIECGLVAADAETGRGRAVDRSGRALLRDGRQSRRQFRQPLLGIRAEGKHYGTATADLLVDSRSEQRFADPGFVGDRLYHFAYAVTHFFQITRWDRTFRVVS